MGFRNIAGKVRKKEFLLGWVQSWVKISSTFISKNVIKYIYICSIEDDILEKYKPQNETEAFMDLEFALVPTSVSIFKFN